VVAAFSGRGRGWAGIGRRSKDARMVAHGGTDSSAVRVTFTSCKANDSGTNTRKSIREGLNVIDIDAILDIGDTGHGDNLDVRIGN
jgi:hypothetical protein